MKFPLSVSVPLFLLSLLSPLFLLFLLSCVLFLFLFLVRVLLSQGDLRLSLSLAANTEPLVWLGVRCQGAVRRLATPASPHGTQAQIHAQLDQYETWTENGLALQFSHILHYMILRQQLHNAYFYHLLILIYK